MGFSDIAVLLGAAARSVANVAADDPPPSRSAALYDTVAVASDKPIHLNALEATGETEVLPRYPSDRDSNLEEQIVLAVCLERGECFSGPRRNLVGSLADRF